MKHRLTILLLALLAPLLVGAPTHADDPYSAALYMPIDSADASVVVQVNAGPGTWGIRKSARAMAAQTSTITVRTSGDCSTADVCVTLVAGDYDPARMLELSLGTAPAWAGLTTYPAATTRTIYLANNTVPRRSRRVHIAAHEMGHVFGLAHHRTCGLMSGLINRQTDLLSAEEIAVLDGWYSRPQEWRSTPTPKRGGA